MRLAVCSTSGLSPSELESIISISPWVTLGIPLRRASSKAFCFSMAIRLRSRCARFFASAASASLCFCSARLDFFSVVCNGSASSSRSNNRGPPPISNLTLRSRISNVSPALLNERDTQAFWHSTNFRLSQNLNRTSQNTESASGVHSISSWFDGNGLAATVLLAPFFDFPADLAFPQSAIAVAAQPSTHSLGNCLLPDVTVCNGSTFPVVALRHASGGDWRRVRIRSCKASSCAFRSAFARSFSAALKAACSAGVSLFHASRSLRFRSFSASISRSSSLSISSSSLSSSASLSNSCSSASLIDCPVSNRSNRSRSSGR